jgi:hypothetical protein
MNHNAPQTEINRMFCCVMLDDPFKGEQLGISFAPIAVEEFLAERLGVGFDLGVEDPPHVLQREFLGERPFWGIDWQCFAGCPRSRNIFCDIAIESAANVEKGFNREPRAILSRDLRSLAPAVMNNLICIACNPNA